MRINLENDLGYVLVCDKTKRILFVQTQVDGVWDFRAIKSHTNIGGKHYSIQLNK